MRDKALIRIRLISVSILLLALVLVGRLYHIQIANGEEYISKGEAQYVHTVRDLYSRGSIYFTTKDGDLVSAATIQSGYVLTANPQLVLDAKEAYEKIKTVLDIDEEDFISKVTNKERVYVELYQQVDEDDASAIAQFDLPGIQLYRTQWRYYPGDDVAARTIGFVGYSGNELSGRYGLERYYEDILRRNDERLSVNFFAEMFGNLGGVVFDNTPARRGDVVTTIEPTVTRYLQNRLEDVQTKWGSKLTAGLVINPKNGEIYAMGAVPNFNLNDRTGVPIEDFRNPIVEDVHEMGSIIKALTMAAGLDSKAVNAQTTYYDAGFLELDDYTIGNFDGKGRGYVDMQEVLNQSLNTGVSFVVDQMGKDSFSSYFKKLNFGTETGIDLPGEIYGLVSNLDTKRDIELATASFGQGIAMTPIATTRALATLGNGGTLVTPHLVKELHFEDGTVQPIVFPEGERVFSEETSEEISRMLVNVVDDALRGGSVKLENYSVAAKTGTAQIADRVNGGYYDDRYLHSFFGYFPAYNPEFLVFLYTVEPKGVRYASETLTEPFIDITEFLINYYSVPPDR